MNNFQLSDGDSVELVEIEYLKAEIILELNTVHDWEHCGRGGATHKQHLRHHFDVDFDADVDDNSVADFDAGADDHSDDDADFDADESYHNRYENKH